MHQLSWSQPRRFLAALVCLLFFATVPSTAQEVRDEGFGEATAIYVIEVPVRVLVKGEPLRGLTQDDFVVLDDGESRQITNFEVIDVTALPANGPTLEPSADVGEAGQAEVSASGRNYLLLFDFAYGGLGLIDARRRLLESVEAAQALVDTGLAPGDHVAVAFFSSIRGFKQVLDFTTDRDAARFALHAIDLVLEAKPKLIREEFAGWAELGPSLPGRRAATPLGPNRASLDDLATEARNWSQRGDPFLWHGLVIKHFAWGLREFTEDHDLPGMNYIVMFSRGPLYGDEQNRALFYLQELFRDLRQENWSIQAVNTGGLGFGRDSLAMLASETGGTLYTNSRDLELLLTEAVEETTASYMLTFQVADLPEDGAYHRLKVRLVDPPRRAKITHRPGYYAPGAIDPKWRRSMAAIGTERSTDHPALTGYDPISVIATAHLESRKPDEGRDDLFTVHRGFRYLFAGQESFNLFLSDPNRYAIRNNGNCPVLAGVQGDPDYFAVLDDGIYVFSSNSARRKFRQHPERYVPGYVPPESGD